MTLPSRDMPTYQSSTAGAICLTGVMFSEGSFQVKRVLDKNDNSNEEREHNNEIMNRENESNNSNNDNQYRIDATLRYRIFRPRQMHMLPAPLVVLHGGPGVPSNYLLNTVNIITDRCIIFYDQLGCGRSSRVMDERAYSIESSVDDLRLLLQHWNLKHYHLLGHSFGGILAFEYLKKYADPKCLSVILSSVPPDMVHAREETKRLLTECEFDKVLYSQTHECRVVPIPLSLQDAYAQAGTIWRGVQAIPDYKAVLKAAVDHDDTNNNDDAAAATAAPITTPCYILRGQHDFITSIEGWQDLFCNSQVMILAGCSHHALLENEELYGGVIGAFLDDHDL